MPFRMNWPLIWMEGTGLSYTERKWNAHFGISFVVMTILWASIPAAEVASLRLEPLHLLWCISWLRLYDGSWETSASHWRCCEKTYRVRVKQVLELLYQNLHEIHLLDRGGPAFADQVLLVLDSTVCPVHCDRTTWDTQKIYYSVHAKMHGLKYEIAVNWLTGRLHWVAGGVFASIADITLTRCSGVLRYLLAEERILADKAYEGEQQIWTPFKGKFWELPPQQRNWNAFMNPPRTIVENAFWRIHKFRILSTTYRGPLEEHPVIFSLIAQIAQLDIHDRPLRADLLENPQRHHLYTDEVIDPVGLVVNAMPLQGE